MLKKLTRHIYYKGREIRAGFNHQVQSSTVERLEDSPDHILIVIIDALRPDFVPKFDGFSNSHAVAPGTWTFPSVTSIHTGEYPHEHGSVARTHTDDEEFAQPEQATPDNTIPVVAELAGYDTYGGFAFVQPFLAVEGWYQNHRIYQDADAEAVINDYEGWRQNRSQTFSTLHLSDLHIPVKPPAEYMEAHDVDTSIYDLCGFGGYTESFDATDESARKFRKNRMRLESAAFDYVTDELQSLFSKLPKDSLVVVTGDHGEALYEFAERDRSFTDSRPNYGVGHGGTPFDTVARVPVAVSDQDILPTGGVASLTDLPITLSKKITPDCPFDGHPWQRKIPENRIAICEACRYGAERKAAYMGSYKVIRSETDDITITSTIEGGSENFGDIPADVKERLLDALPDSWDDLDSHQSTNRIVKDQLEALGYK